MSKFTKVTVIAATVMLLVGASLFLIGFFNGGKPGIVFGPNGFTTFENKEMQKVNEDLEAFYSVSVNLSSMDIQVVGSDRYGIEIENQSDNKINYQVENGTLTVNEESGFGVHFGFSFGAYKQVVKLYVPKETVLENIQLDLSSGDVNMSDVKSNILLLESSSGDVRLNGVSVAKQAKFEMSSGDFEANNIAVNNLKLNSSSGDINIHGTLTGQTGIECSSGDIEIALTQPEKDFNCDVETMSGDLSIGTLKLSGKYAKDNNAIHSLNIKAMSGDVEVDFQQ